jgi:hypothetical protein
MYRGFYSAMGCLHGITKYINTFELTVALNLQATKLFCDISHHGKGVGNPPRTYQLLDKIAPKFQGYRRNQMGLVGILYINQTGSGEYKMLASKQKYLYLSL